MLQIRTDKVPRLLSKVLLLGCLGGNPLPGNSDEANMRALYWSCVEDICGPVIVPEAGAPHAALGYIKENAEPGTVPLYWACAYMIAYEGCGQRILVAQPRCDDSVLLGYIQLESQPGTVPLYWSCKQRNSFGECIELAPDNRDDTPNDSVLLGYVYAAAHRQDT
jgi:hypothetical protein